MGDGGKWVCGMSRYVNLPPERPCIIYSFGVQNESSFGKFALLKHMQSRWLIQDRGGDA